MGAFICDAIRTPIGRYGGEMATMRPDDLAAHVIMCVGVGQVMAMIIEVC